MEYYKISWKAPAVPCRKSQIKIEKRNKVHTSFPYVFLVNLSHHVATYQALYLPKKLQAYDQIQN